MCIHVSQVELHSAVVIEDQNHIFSKHYNLNFMANTAVQTLLGTMFTQKEQTKYLVLVRTLV